MKRAPHGRASRCVQRKHIASISALLNWSGRSLSAALAILALIFRTRDRAAWAALRLLGDVADSILQIGRGGARRSRHQHRATSSVAPTARAAPIRATCSSRLGGAAAAGRRRHFVLADCCSQILVRGDDGARAIDDDDVGGRRRDLRGHRQQIGKSAALTVGALALARAALRRPRH